MSAVWKQLKLESESNPGTLSGALGGLKSTIQIQSIIIIIIINPTVTCNICYTAVCEAAFNTT